MEDQKLPSNQNKDNSRTYYTIEFTGKAGEFFRIWIVNVLLSIITLGIYSAWAKVRTKQYFYGNTYLDNSSFEYTADPKKILKGRIIALGLIVAYQAISHFYPNISGIAFLVGIILVPAIIVMAMRFRMRYSRWRGIHFNFDPDFKASYFLFTPVILYFSITALAPFYLGINLQEIGTAQQEGSMSADMTTYFSILGIAIFIAMLLFPWWQNNYYRFIGNRTRFGTLAFRFIGNAMEFYALYFATFGIFLVGIIIAVGFVAIGSLIPVLIAFMPLLFIFPYALAASYMQTAKTNTIYSNLELGDIFFTSELKLKKMMYLYVTNTLAILLTLGLAIPWARIRMAHYRAQTLRLFANNFDDFSALQASQQAAQAEEISDIFDLDIGL